MPSKWHHLCRRSSNYHLPRSSSCSTLTVATCDRFFQWTLLFPELRLWGVSPRLTLIWFCRWFFKSSPSSDLEEFHGGPPSCPNLVGIDVALFSRLAILLHFGGHGLHYDPCPQHVRSSLASRVGNVPYDYGGFFCTASPHTTTVTTIMATAALLRIMGGTRLPKCLRWCIGGIMLLPGIYPCLCTVVGPFPRAMGGIPMQLHRLP